MGQQHLDALAVIRSSAIDGRAENPIFRKRQLKLLHEALVKHTPEIQASIREDKALTENDADIELYLALQCVVDAHDAIDTVKAFEAEYSVSRGRDYPDSRRPVGVVIIQPTLHAFVHSLLAALAPALATGNCVIVQTENTLRSLPRGLLDIIADTLDRHVFMISTKHVLAQDLHYPHVRVVQESARRNDESDGQQNQQQIESLTETPVIALVERGANVAEAAKALTSARFVRAGQAPYAPDVVLVNEWVKDAFIGAVVQQQLALHAPTQKNMKRSHDLTKAVESEAVSIISSTDQGAIVEVRDRNMSLLSIKAQHPCLVICTVKSIDDAIDITRKIGNPAAAYVFALPPAAKYFCQFVQSSVSFINYVPMKLLHGPMAPKTSTALDLTGCLYTPEMFTVPQPQYISRSAINRRLGQMVPSGTTASAPSVKSLLVAASKELSDVKRPDHVSPIGFFEQGIITGLAMTLTVIVGGLGVSGFFLRK